MGLKDTQRASSEARFIFIGCGVICLHAAALWMVNVETPQAVPTTPPFVVLVAPPQLPPSLATAPTATPAVKPTAQIAQAPLTQKPAKVLENPATTPAATKPAPALIAATAPLPSATSIESAPITAVAPAYLPTQTPDRNATAAGAGTDKTTPSVQLPSSNADYLNNPAPVYPALSQRLGEQGKVVIRVLIGKDGTALQADIQQSSGFDRLDQAALRAVMGWRYVPGQRGGIAQDMWFNVPVNFSLN